MNNEQKHVIKNTKNAKKLLLSGCGTALVTPFNIDEEVAYAVFRKLVRRQINAGIHFLVPLGTTGEATCLTDNEKLKLAEISCEEAAKKNLPVIVGAGSNSTKQTVANVKMFLKANIPVSGFLIVTPYYNKPTQGGLFAHYQAVADATDKPIVIYNVPGRTGVNMSAETCLKLSELTNIVATKEASSNYSQISEIIRNAPPGFNVISGNDEETLSLMATGAKGVISVASNLVPNLIVELVNLLLEKQLSPANDLHHRLAALFKNCFVESNPIPVKAGLFCLRLIDNALRLPLQPATSKTLELMEKTLAKLVKIDYKVA